MTELVRAGDLAALEQMDPAVREEAVTRYLEHARDQLTLAISLSDSGIAALTELVPVKAEVATAADAARHLGLSREIQADAVEMVRRSEYALGKAIRAGQERGEIWHTRLGKPRPGNDPGGDSTWVRPIPSPSAFASPVDIHPGATGTPVYDLVDGVTDAQFEAALSEARAEGNLSRANVARKTKAVAAPVGMTPRERLAKIRELAPTGHTCEQIAREVGISELQVRARARDAGIEITADKVMKRSHHRIDSNRITEETVNTLEGLLTGVRLVDYGDLDATQAEHWADSLKTSIQALTRFMKKIKETTQ